MALDADTNYYAMPDDATGLSPLLDPNAAQAVPDPAGAGQPAPALASLLALLDKANPKAANAPALAALMRDPGITQGGPPAPSPDSMQALPPPADPDYENIVQPAAAPVSAPTQSASPLPQSNQMPQMPKHNDTILQVLGTLSALAGGAGGNLAGQYIQNRDARDLQNYNQQTQQQQVQQQTQNNQADASGQFLDRLGKLDAASQEATVRNMTPSMMAAYGYTPAQVKAQFFDAAGNFKPVTADDAKQAPALLRAQAAGRARMAAMTPTGQENLYLSYANDHDGYEQAYGMPYPETFALMQNQRDVTDAGRAAETVSNDAATQLYHGSLAQNANYKTFLSLTPALQAARIAGYASHPQDTLTDLGVPFTSLKPGMTEANLISSTATTNRETDAQRTASDHMAATKMNIAARAAISQADNGVTMRGQDLRADLENKAINQRAHLFSMKYGDQSKAVEKQYQDITKERMLVMKRMTELSKAPIDSNGDVEGLSPRDQGRIDAGGNIVANPAPTPAYNEYMQLQAYDQQLQKQQAVMKSFGGPAPGSPPPTVQLGGGGPLRPAPVTVNGKTGVGAAGMTQGTSPLAPSVPPVPVYTSHDTTLPPFPAYTSHQTALSHLRAQVRQPARPAAASAHLTPAQIHGMTTGQLLQRLAAKYAGGK